LSNFLSNANSRIILLLIFGISIREALSPFTGHPYDFELWVRLGYYLSQGQSPYVLHPPVPGLSFPATSAVISWPGYPPIWPVFTALIYKFYASIGFQNRFFYYFLLKQPMIAADIANALIIRKLVSQYSNAPQGFKALAFWIFCPYTIIISSVWGMFDQIVLLLVLLSIYFIGKTLGSSLLESLGIALKLLPVIFLPLFIGVQENRKKILLYGVFSAVFALLLAFFPFYFYGGWDVSGLTSVAVHDVNRVANSLNYWQVILGYLQAHEPISPSVYYGLLDLDYVWIPLVLVASYYCITSIRSRSNLNRNLMLSCLFIVLVFFLTKSAISEQFVIYFLGFAVFDYYVVSSRQRRLLFHAVWLSALAFLIINSALLDYFLFPLSTYYYNLSLNLDATAFGTYFQYWIDVPAILFTIFCALYLVNLLGEIKRVRATSNVGAIGLVAKG
jgi:hypothetical protein